MGCRYGLRSSILAAVEEGADIINLSLGSFYPSSAEASAIAYALSEGVTVVAAMGNDGSNTMCFPAAYDYIYDDPIFDNLISVVASDPNNTRAPYSNYGKWADIAAPGTRIYSSVLDDSYESWSGTSMATPVVAGVAALYKSIHPNAAPAQIKARLKATATKGGSDLGVGIVNAANMLSEKTIAPGFYIGQPQSVDNPAVYYDTDKETTAAQVPCESALWFFANTADKNDYILYTLDGSTPAVKDGKVANGTVYDHAEDGIDLSAYAGKTITVKAIQVNGLGMASPVLTRKVTVQTAAAANITTVTISGPSTLIAGKTGEFTAVVEPAATASQAVTWSIDSSSPNMRAATIDSKGKLKVPAIASGETGTVVVKATSKDNPDAYATKTVHVWTPLPVRSMKLDEAKASLYVDENLTLSVSDVLDTAKKPITPDDLEYRWTSSNPAVATVDSKGSSVTVRANTKGTATITCKVLDGSGKSAKCTVTVMQQVESLVISGQYSIAPGASATYKAAAYPTTANNKKVTWSLVNAPEGVSIDPNKGTVKVAASVEANERFTVVATALTHDTVQGVYEVIVADKCSYVSIEPVSYYEDGMWWLASPGIAPGYQFRKGKLSSIGLYNVDLKETTDTNNGRENRIQLNAYTSDDALETAECIVWSSSNSAVASVDSDGWVTAHKAGTTKITAAANDGSRKKATVTVKVTIPASYIELTTSAPKGNYDMCLLAVGKSAKHKAVLGSTYGKPSNTKVYWGWNVGYYDEVRDQWIDLRRLYAGDIGGMEDQADPVKLAELEKMFSCSGGTLTAKASSAKLLEEFEGEEIWVNVYASQEYGLSSGVYGYRLVKPTTKLFIGSCGMLDDGGYYLNFYCDQYRESFFDNRGQEIFYSDFVLTSSNNDVANITVCGSANNGWHTVYFDSYKPGKSKITIKTTDGTNKSASVTVNIG